MPTLLGTAGHSGAASDAFQSFEYNNLQSGTNDQFGIELSVGPLGSVGFCQSITTGNLDAPSSTGPFATISNHENSTPEYSYAATPVQGMVASNRNPAQLTTPFMDFSFTAGPLQYNMDSNNFNMDFNNFNDFNPVPDQMTIQPQVFPDLTQGGMFYLTSPPPILCAWVGCTKTFTRQSGMVRHYQSIHEGKRYHCKWLGCANNNGQGYRRDDQRKNHERKKHGSA